MFAYNEALAGESIHDGLRDKWNGQSFDGVTLDDLNRYARIVAFKVAHNLSNGLIMDWDDPLEYTDCSEPED